MQRFLIGTAMLAAALTSSAESVYTGFHWIDPVNKQTHTNSMLIEDQGEIIYIGPQKEVSDSASVIDLNGKYVIAGFIDTHAHVTLGAVNMQKQRGKLTLAANHSDDISRHNGRVMLAYGITDIRNPGGDSNSTVRYKTKVKNGEWIGPDAFTAGEILDRHPFPGLSTAVSNAADIDAEIARQKALGVDFIKLYTSLDVSLLNAGIQAAGRNALPTVAHLDAIPWDSAAAMGLDAIVHAMPTSIELLNGTARQEYLDTRRLGSFAFFEWYEAADFDTPRFKQMLTALAQNNTMLDLTLVAFHNAFWGDQPSVTSHPELKLAHPELIDNWQSFFTFTIGWKPADFERAKAVWPKVEQLTRLLHQAGIRISIGTDMGNPWVIPGVSFHQEMQLLADAGIDNYAILKMATSNGAESIYQHDHKGTLAPGKSASFVVLDKNPVADIKHSLSIHAVVKSGIWHQPHNLITSSQ